MTGGTSGFVAHAVNHPDHDLKIKGKAVKFVEKKYYCPLDNNWYSCLKWLSRAIKKQGWTIEKYYLTYGENYVADKWQENLSKPLFGYRHCTNTCLQCDSPLKFIERRWRYPVFCGYKCSTTWYAYNTNRVKQAQETLRARKQSNPDHALNPTQLRYWMVVHGLDEKQAQEKVYERQSINKLEDYIKRAGGDVYKGHQLFIERQLRWLNSLKKTTMKKGSSATGSKLFDAVAFYVPEIRYGNQEAIIQISDTTIRVDCLLESKRRIIEFYGDYWHGNPQKFEPDDIVAIRKVAKDVWFKDQNRTSQLQAAGYDVLIIWESEFKRNPQIVIEKCLSFLNT